MSFLQGPHGMALFLVMDSVIDRFPFFALATGNLSAKREGCLRHRVNFNEFL